MRTFDYARQQLREINKQIKELDEYYAEKRKAGTYTSSDHEMYYNQRSNLYGDYDYFQQLMESCEE